MKGIGVRLNLEVGDETPPLVAVSGIRQGLEGIEAGLRANVARARASGHSWQEIAGALGVTRQSAWERFGSSEDEERAAAIRSVVGVFKRPPGSSTFEEMRAEDREAEAEREVRRYGESPPGLRWR